MQRWRNIPDHVIQPPRPVRIRSDYNHRINYFNTLYMPQKFMILTFPAFVPNQASSLAKSVSSIKPQRLVDAQQRSGNNIFAVQIHLPVTWDHITGSEIIITHTMRWHLPQPGQVEFFQPA